MESGQLEACSRVRTTPATPQKGSASTESTPVKSPAQKKPKCPATVTVDVVDESMETEVPGHGAAGPEQVVEDGHMLDPWLAAICVSCRVFQGSIWVTSDFIVCICGAL